MDQEFIKKQTAVFGSIVLSIIALIGFMSKTGILARPMALILIPLFLLFPYRRESLFVKRMIILASILFIVWILSDLGAAILPFFLSFLIAYILDPFVVYLTTKKIPRWLASISIVGFFVGLVTGVAVGVFPTIFSQLDQVLTTLSGLVKTMSDYLESKEFYATLSEFGLKQKQMKPIIQKEFIPELQNLFELILHSLLSFFKSLQSVATQLFNAIIIPVLAFYLLKDFDKLKRLIKSLVGKKDPKMLNDLKRINQIIRKYIGWQILAALIVATTTSIAFSLYGIPYPIVLGILCGVFNPIPYLGIFISMVIGIFTVVLVDPSMVWSQGMFIILVISALHFINAYFLEPNIAGKQVGLHPVMLIASLFIFGTLFGLVGLLIAVPGAAILMMFFNDWRDKTERKDNIIIDNH